MSNRRTLQKDLAQTLRLSQATISLALSSHPRISEATRNKVLLAAKKLGYCPDPYLSSLAEYRRKRRKIGYRATIAWVHNYPAALGWQDDDVYSLLYRSAFDQAKSLGYKLENFWLRGMGPTSERANEVLLSRGIRGLLIMPQHRIHGHLGLDWSQFSVVRLGDYTLTKPEFHVVTVDHYRTMFQSLRNLRKCGYRRIGFVSLQRIESRLDESYIAAYLRHQMHLSKEFRVCPLVMKDPNHDDIKKWYAAHRPDAILFSYDHAVYDMMKSLKALGVEIPRDVGVAFLRIPSNEIRFSGAEEHLERVASRAVEFLAGMIDRAERGIPENPLRVLVGSTWREGTTLRKCSGIGSRVTSKRVLTQ